jgi:hypothetical protein
VCCAEVTRGCSWDGVGCAKASADFTSAASGTWRSLERCFPNAMLRCSTRTCRAGALGGSGDDPRAGKPRACRGAPKFDEKAAKADATRTAR